MDSASGHPLLWGSSDEVKPYSAIPGPKEYPVVGTLLDFNKRDGAKRPWDLQNHYYKEYGPIVKMNLLGRKEVIVYHPQEFLKVFQAEGVYPSGAVKEVWPFHLYNELRFKGSYGILAEGETWLQARRKLQKHMFAPKVAASYAPLLARSARRCSEQLDRMLQEGSAVHGSSFLEKCIFELFTAFAFGTPKDVLSPAADPKDLQFVPDSQDCLSLAMHLMFNPLARYLPSKNWTLFVGAWDRSHARARDWVRDYVKAREAGQLPPYAAGEEPYVERCLANGELSSKELETDLPNVLLAAVDTTVHVVKWLMVHLAENPHVQQKLREELQTVLKGNDFQREDRAQLPYLHAVVRESHRLTPAGWSLTYRNLPEDITLSGYHIPAGTPISFNVTAVQRDPRVVGDDAMHFRPERFLADEVEARKSDPLRSLLDHRLLTTPFSFGARMCLGARVAEMETAALLARLVQDFRFEPHPAVQPWEMTWGTMIKPEPFPMLRYTRL